MRSPVAECGEPQSAQLPAHAMRSFGVSDPATPWTHLHAAQSEQSPDRRRVDIEAKRDSGPRVAGEVGALGFVDVGFAQDRPPWLLDAGAFEAVVDGGAVHVEVAADLPDGGSAEVRSDDLVDDSRREASVSHPRWCSGVRWSTLSAIWCGGLASMVRKLSTKDHHRFRRSRAWRQLVPPRVRRERPQTDRGVCR